jgi:hypothetical protein
MKRCIWTQSKYSGIPFHVIVEYRFMYTTGTTEKKLKNAPTFSRTKIGVLLAFIVSIKKKKKI